MALSIEG